MRVVGGKVCNRCDGEMKAGMERSQQSYRQHIPSTYSSLKESMENIALLCFYVVGLPLFLIGMIKDEDDFIYLGCLFFVVGWLILSIYQDPSYEKMQEIKRVFHKGWAKHELKKHKYGFYLSNSTKKKFMQPPIDAQNIEDSDKSIESEIVEMIQLLQSSLPDAIKHDKGVKIAGVRLRKSMQVTKITADRLSARVREELRIRW
ncbi:hypothetical protein N9N11_00560 [Candidatus Poseidoniales archaeon]|nr:hypothetical protein [Candidatus Poseidoniales archaeon]